MKLTRYNPVPGTTIPSPLLSNRLERLFEDAFGSPRFPESLGYTPAVDIVELKDELVLTAELPGMRAEDVSIDIENNMLRIRGEKKMEREQEKEKTYLWERSYGMFERAFTLPRTVDPDRIEAEVVDGVLTVHLPKTEQAKGKKIPVTSK
jgi:HSP20 family protein